MKILEFLKPGYKEQLDLNPSIWQDENNLQPEVKEQIAKIAQHFKQFVDVEFPVLDIVVTGGQTGKYYTEDSDLDIHLITNYNQIDCDQEIAELFNTKKTLYKKTYDIKIKGIEVELYVEDIEMPAVGGAFSLVKNKWIRNPTQPNREIDKEKIENLSLKLSQKILKALSSNKLDTLKEVKRMIWQYRKLGLAKEGEFGTANLVFKTLRNSGILQRLVDKILELENQKLSLP